MLRLNISNIAVEGVDYHYIIHDISKSEAYNLFKNSVFMIVGIYKMYAKEINIKNRVYIYYFDNLVKAK